MLKNSVYTVGETVNSIYTVGGTVQAGGGIYLSRRVDEELLALCRAGQYANVLTTRQVGKSSLMIRTSAQLRAEGIRTVIIDISKTGKEVTIEQWYRGLIKKIAEQVELNINASSWWETHADEMSELERFTEFIQKVLLVEVAEPIVIFVDEIDTTRALPFASSFFTALRALYNERAKDDDLKRLSFVLIGVAAPIQLIQSKHETPWNIGVLLELTDFTFDEALPFAAGLGLPQDDARQVLRWVLKWTNGHPFLTQRICRDIAQAGRDGWNEADVDTFIADMFIGKNSVPDSNIEFVRDMLTARAPDAEAVLKAYRKVRRGSPPVLNEDSSMIKSHLKLAGIVRREGEVLQVRNLIYRETFNEQWITDHIPVNWPKRLQRAVLTVIVFLVVITLPLSVVAGIGWSKANAAGKALKQSNDELEGKNLELNTKSKELVETNKQLKVAVAEAQTSANKAMQAERKASSALARESKALKNEQIAKAKVQKSLENERIERVKAEVNLAKYEESLSRFHTYKGSQEMLKGNDLESLVFLNEALQQGNPNEALQQGKLNNRPVIELLLKSVLRKMDSQMVSVGHHDLVRHAAFSPDGKLIVSACKDGTVKVWDARVPERVQPLVGHKDQVRYAVFLGNDRVVTASDDRTAKIWNAKTGEMQKSLEGHKGRVIYVAAHADTKRIVTASADKTAKVWNAETGELMWTLGEEQFNRHEDIILSAEFSPQGQRIVTASMDGTAKVWETASGKLLKTLRDIKRSGDEFSVPHVYYAAFSHDGNYVVTASRDKTAQIWDLTSDKKDPAFTLRGHTGGVIYATFSQYTQLVITTSIDGKAKVWNKETGKLKHTLEGHTGPVTYAAFSADGNRIVTAGVDGSVKVWDAGNGGLLASWNGHGAPVNVAAFEPKPENVESERIITASEDGTTKIWAWNDINLLNFSRRKHRKSVNSAMFSPKSDYVVTASEDGSAKIWNASKDIWNASKDKLIEHQIIHPNSNGSPIHFATFSRDGKRILTASEDRTARIWNVEEMWKDIEHKKTEASDPEHIKWVDTFGGHSGIVRYAEFNSDGSRIVTASDDGTAKIWDTTAPTATVVKSLEGHRGVVNSAMFDSADQYILTASMDGTAKVWDARDFKLVNTLEGHSGGVSYASFNSDASRIVTAGVDGLGRLWDWRSPKEFKPILLKGHKGRVYSAVFSPKSGNFVLTAGEDGTARLFNANSGEWLVTVGVHTNPLRFATFSPDEKHIVTVDTSGVTKVWDFNLSELPLKQIQNFVLGLVPFEFDQSRTYLKSKPPSEFWVNDRLKLNAASPTR